MKVKDALKVDKPKVFADNVMYNIYYTECFNRVTNDINELTIAEARTNLLYVRECVDRLIETLDKLENDI